MEVPEETVFLPVPNWEDGWCYMSPEKYWCERGFWDCPVSSFPLGYFGKFTMMENPDVQKIVNIIFSPLEHFRIDMLDILKEKDHGDYVLVDRDIWQIAVEVAKCECCDLRKINRPPPLDICGCRCHMIMLRLNELAMAGNYYRTISP